MASEIWWHTISSFKHIMASGGKLKVVKGRLLDYICTLFTTKPGNNVVACISMTFRPLPFLHSQEPQVGRKKLVWIPHWALPTMVSLPSVRMEAMWNHNISIARPNSCWSSEKSGCSARCNETPHPKVDSQHSCKSLFTGYDTAELVDKAVVPALVHGSKWRALRVQSWSLFTKQPAQQCLPASIAAGFPSYV